MLLSVKEITEIQLLKGANIKAGKATMAEKVVEWVSVIESPVENFVRENEFVLTTGIGCYGDVREFMRFVEDVYDSGASVLAIATGRYIFEIPEEIIRYADKRGFTIIDIPWEIRFADIVHEVMSKLKDFRSNVMKRSEEFQQHLIQMIIEGRTLAQITKDIERELKKTLLIRNRKGEVVAGSACPEQVSLLWNQMNENVATQQSQHPIHTGLSKLENGDNQLLHLPIDSNGIHEGDFFILLKSDEELNEQEVTITEQVVVAAALWFTRSSAVKEAEIRMRNEFILKLARGDKMSTKHVDAHAEFFRFDLELPYVSIVGYPENLEDLIEQKKSSSKSMGTRLEQLSIYVREGLFYASENMQREILIAFEGDEVIIFLQSTDDSTADTVNQFLDLVERRFSHLLPGVIFSWGIGKHKKGKWYFKDNFQKGKAALDMGRKQRGVGKRTHFDDTRINRLLLNLAMVDEVQDVAMTTVYPLVEYDIKREMNLIKTFTVYTKNKGNVSQTARELNLHRQSLLYRLRKIESLTELSLVDPDDLFLLDFSIKIWTTGMLKKRKV